MKAALCCSLAVVVTLLSLNCNGHSGPASSEGIIEAPSPIQTYLPLEVGTQWTYDYYIRTETVVDIFHTGRMRWTVSQKLHFDNLVVYNIDVRKDDRRVVGGVRAPNPDPGDTTTTVEEYSFDISVDAARVSFSGDRFQLGLVTNCFQDSSNFANIPDTVRYACKQEPELANEIFLVRNVGIAHRVYHYRYLTDDIYMKFELTGFETRQD